MKRGVCALVVLVLLAAAVQAFEVDVSPGTINAEVQAGGYVAELITINADAPVDVFAAASPSLTGILKLTRHNATAVVIHVLPPMASSGTVAKGVLELDVQGTNPSIGAGLQHVTVPLNVTISVVGTASAPAVVDLSNEKEIEIVPLSGGGATLLAVVIAGIVTVNIVLRTRTGRKKK